MDQEILVPDIGDYNNVEIIEVAIKEGDQLSKDATMITLETDKATMDIPAPRAIKINTLKVKVGDRVSKGSVIALATNIDGSDLDLSKQNTTINQNQSKATENTTVAVNNIENPVRAENSSSGLRGFANASPSVRKFAREVGVNLDQVSGTGNHGRIVEEDVKTYIHKVINNNLIDQSNKKNDIDFSKWGKVKEQALSRIKKKSGQHLHKSWLSIPHVTHFEQADITELEQFRKNQQGSELAKDLKITLLIFIIQAVVAALKEYPAFNSSLSVNGENLILKDYYNIGIAVDTEAGLVVPVVKNADNFSNIFTLAAELAALSQKARNNKLTIEDLTGGCFTISSLGGVGGNNFTPIINAPEVAILGVARHKLMPMYINDQELKPRLILPLALSYDHRVIDGAEAAKFCKFIVNQLENVKNFYV